MAKPIEIWVVSLGPNPWKIVTLCEELDISYEIHAMLKAGEVKQQPYIDINPNGRAPVYDPNTGLTIWESGAIVLYLVEQYDTAHKLSYGSIRERHLCQQWLIYQITGQGPYWGQFVWFQLYHHEKLPSASKRYAEEIRRVLGVLETQLSKRSWLVGDRMTYADMSFVMWNYIIHQFYDTPGHDPLEEFPAVKKWHAAMVARPAFRKTELLRWKYQMQGGLSPDTGLPEGVSVEAAIRDVDEQLEMQRRPDKAAVEGCSPGSQ